MTAICSLEDIPKLGARRYVRGDGETIAVFRTAADTVFALARPLPAQGRTALAGHRLRRKRRLPAAQLVHRPEERRGGGAGRGRREALPVRSWTVELSTSPALASERETRTTCCYCGTGCGVIIASEAIGWWACAAIPTTRPTAARLCSKGTTLHLTMTPGRWRRARASRDAHCARCDARRAYRGTPRSTTSPSASPRSSPSTARRVAFYVSGQLLTEDYYAFNKLAKGLIGTANIDTNSRLCMSSAVSGYAKTLGVDAPPACYDDIDARALPLHRRLEHRVRAPGALPPHRGGEGEAPGLTIVVVDPRRTETARFADLHLPILPGTDVALFHAMLHVMLWEDLVDEAYIAAHTEGSTRCADRAASVAQGRGRGLRRAGGGHRDAPARWFAGSGPTPLRSTARA
jgi:assimilatory nitrate reductase catalytic subunit